MENTTTITKVCIRCGERKPLSAFYGHPKTADKHKSVCADCEKARLRELRREKAEGQPAKKVGRPNESAARSEAAKKANAARAQRPSITARNAEDIIKQLEDDRQPWILIKYPFNIRGLKEMGGICYEVVIWQTCESDHGYASFEMDAATARKVIEQYGLKERKRYKSEGAIIWSKNDRLQELHQRYVRSIERLNAKAKLARNLYTLLGDNRDIMTAEEYVTMRDKAADAEQDYIVKRNKYAEEYPAKNGIIIYNL